jgi:hypothetical protein
MARILYAVDKHDETSKQQAAAWAIKNYAQYKDVVAQALAWRAGMPMDAQEVVYDLMGYVATRLENTAKHH